MLTLFATTLNKANTPPTLRNIIVSNLDYLYNDDLKDNLRRKNNLNTNENTFTLFQRTQNKRGWKYFIRRRIVTPFHRIIDAYYKKT